MTENLCHQNDAAVSSLPLYSIPLIPSLDKLSAADFVQSLSYSPSVLDFKCLLEDSNGVELFKRFLDKERAAHYLDFWFACQGFKTAENDKVYQLIKVIYRAYVRSESQCAVALKPNTKKNIVDKLSNKQCLDKSIFDNAQLEIRDILISDFYQRFIKSESFKLYQQSSLHSGHSKSSENTESLKEQEPSYVECCGIISSPPLQKNQKDKTDFFCKFGRGKVPGCGNNNKDRRSLAESDPLLFVQQVSSKLEKLHLMQHCGRSTNADHMRQADITEVLEDDAESILDNHCSYLMTKDSTKMDPAVLVTSKHDADIRSVLSHDSGVATTFDSQWNSRLPPPNTYVAPTSGNSGFCQATQQYKHHHTHDHHHFRTRRRNRSEDQSVCSLEEKKTNNVLCVIRKGKSQASDASSIFDSGVSSTYEQLSHPWNVTSDRVSNWVNTNPGIVNTPVELSGCMKRSCSAQTPGYKNVISEKGEPSGPLGEVWIDSCCIETSPEKPKGKCTTLKSKCTSQPGCVEASIVVGYYFCGDPVPYRSQVPCVEGHFTLGQFKQLLPKRGPYRYFFKRPCDEFEGNGAVQEEYTDDDALLPLWEGKIVAKVEKTEPS